MFNLGSGEILLIFLGILLMFGAKKLPELARGLGKGLNEFRDAVETGKKEILETKKDIGLDQESQEKTE
ncbi:MAG: Sec-independent protein translocase subunit TatA/TatB [Fidelibacterota bacterium]|jgi:sec-independent protein translocase protein TatA|tara:strand:- start:39 stop:245 length:207 start_codon:yes stop_codon:yes gene_type:complete